MIGDASVAITAVHGVAPLIMINRVKGIKRDGSKAPDPDEENDKIHSCITKHHIVVLTMFGRVPHNATLKTKLMPADTKGNGTLKTLRLSPEALHFHLPIVAQSASAAQFLTKPNN